MKPIHILTATLPIFLSLPVQAAPLAGARPKEWPASADHHKVTIRRVAADGVEKQLIEAAEKSQPDSSALFESMAKEGGAGKPQPGQWWNKETLGIRIPFAITAETVSYYSGLVGEYGRQKLNRYAQPSSAFTYQAEVSKPATYELDGKSLQNVSVVTMTLSFRQQFVASVAEGFAFEKKREVVFDKDGTIIHVVGDGDVPIAIFSM
jgi:hypothetical protein